jgi:hypothetical protein
LIVLFAIESIIPTPPHADNRDFGHFLGTDAGQHFLKGAWGWFGLERRFLGRSALPPEWAIEPIQRLEPCT